MGGVLEGEVGIVTKTSPHGAAIEKAQSELRKEYDVRDERRRELEFLEKGGDPLDFKLGQTASVSVQSTSHIEQHAEQVVTSAVKGCSTLNDMSLGDFVRTSGRLGAPTVYEPNSADNLLLFDGENKLLESKRNPTRPNRRNTFMYGSQTKESEDCVIFRPYARRNRSRSNRDRARSSSTDTVPSRGGNDSSVPSHQNSKGTILEINNQKDQNKSSTSILNSNNQLDMEIKDTQDNEQYQRRKSSTPQTVVEVDPMIGPEIVSSRLCATTTENESESNSSLLNGLSSLKRDRESLRNKAEINCNALRDEKFNPKLSCTQISPSFEGSNEGVMFNNIVNVDDIIIEDQMLVLEGTGNLEGEVMVKKNNETRPINSGAVSTDCDDSVHQKHKESDFIVKVEEMHEIEGGLNNVVKFPSQIEGKETSDCALLKTDVNPDINSNRNIETSSTTRATMGSSFYDTNLPGKSLSDAPGLETCDNNSELVNKAREDSIMEEARVIEAKRKRISELSVSTLLLANRKKSQWDFVLEEMAWLANDFAQERLWKISFASQISNQVASSLRSRFEERNQSEEQNLFRKQKKVAFTLANAVMHFWHSVEELVNTNNPIFCVDNCDFDGSARDAEGKLRKSNMETSKEGELKGRENVAPVKAYGVRFLKYNRTIVPCIQSESPPTPDKMSDFGIQELSFKNHFMNGSIFYKVSSDAMKIYRKSIESLILNRKTVSGMMKAETATSMYDNVEEFSQEIAYEEEGKTNDYYYAGSFEGGKPSKFSQKKRKNLKRVDLQYGHDTIGPHQSIIIGKRPANSLSVGSIPTKRVRTASRQRVQSPFSNVQAVNKTEASSGDTNYFQDDHSTMYSGSSQFHRNWEVEHEKYDSREMLTKPKKKKKTKHLNSTYEQRWQHNSMVRNEKRDNSTKRPEGHHHLESNESSGLYGQHNAKKLKMMKQSLDTNFDIISPMTVSIPSPTASHMSNMSDTNKIIKLIGARDLGKKSIELKMPAENPGAEIPWSLFEDQALVVLVHDMGPNWELVTDAINTTLQFKCLFRKPKECKERHKNLMEDGDGADSDEDSGSSQPYPSTLPGIPKGSARQLFQHLQGPMEEDTLKSHFEKIISIGRRQHQRRSQNDNQDLKQIAPVHNSHMVALASQFPNNLNGGFLTPLELCALCDAATSNPGANTRGFQGPHLSGLENINQGSATPIPPVSPNSLQGSSSMVLGSNMALPSGPINPSIRDGRYGLPRTSLPLDEQQRLQQYNSMISGRNMQQSSKTVSGGTGNERGTRMPPSGNGLGMAAGINRSMQMSRPGFHGIASSSSMLNSGSMLSSSSMVGLPSPGTMQPGASSIRGSSMFRPREALHMVRAMEHQRQMMTPELHAQITQGNNGQGAPFSGPSSNQTSSSVLSYPLKSTQQYQIALQNSKPHHPHLQGMRHTAYAQLKERQLHQQRMMQQHQQRHFSASNALMPHVQPPSTMQNDSLIQQTSQPLPSLTPSSPNMTPIPSQLQQKLMSHGVGRGLQGDPSGINNLTGKQRQRQAQQQRIQQSGRQHPQQQQSLTQSQQQPKLLKEMGRGNILGHQNLNGVSINPLNLVGEKEEQAIHLMQGQGLHSGSGISRPVVPHQNLLSAKSPTFSKQLQQSPSSSDNGSQGQALHQPPPAMTPNHPHKQLRIQPDQKQVIQTKHNVQRVLHQNHQINSDLPNSSVSDQTHPDQRPVNNSSDIGTSTPPVSVEPVYDSVMQKSATSMGSIGGLPLKNTTRSNSIPQINQVILQRQFSGGLLPQEQQQQPHLKQALGVAVLPTQPNQQEQVEESKEQKLSQQQVSQNHTQQQTEIL